MHMRELFQFMSYNQEMKSGNIMRLRGGHISIALVVLMFTTIFLWAWDKRYFASFLPLTREQYMIPVSGI